MTHDEEMDAMDFKRRAPWKVIITILLVAGLILAAIVMKSFQNKESVQIMREARLYGYTKETVPIIQDETGHLWEVPWMQEIIGDEDRILIQIDTGASYRDSSDDTIYRTWVQIPEAAGVYNDN